jgi:MarR family transcriptional regulator, 2-MHQ and catechol-resistance regulon repressor
LHHLFPPCPEFVAGAALALYGGGAPFVFLAEAPKGCVHAKLLLSARPIRLGGVRVDKRPFFTTYTTSLWVRFLRFGLQSHKKLEDDLHKVGLTPPQFYVLATIGYAGGLPFGEIGAKMMVTVSNLTGIVDRLEEKKLVLRKRDEHDRRVVHVVLTDKGAKLYMSTLPVFEQSAAEIFAALNSKQQKELSALLRRLHPESATK